MIVSEYKEEKPNKHWQEVAEPLHLYKFSDVYDNHLYKTLKTAITSHLTNYNKLTYATHRTSFTFNERRLHVVSHQQNDRLQDIVYDLTFMKDYWYQTSDTIHDWAWHQVQNQIHPIFFHHLRTFKNVKPHTDEPDAWVPTRFHINYLTYSRYLHVHNDMNPQYFNTSTCNFARARSLTFYLHDHIPGYGGELYFLSGYVHRPKENEGVLINGNGAFHGVNSNMNPDKKPRLAFTVRWAHKDDLYLPGSPENALYRLDFPQEQ